MYGANAYSVYKNNSINFASKEKLLLMLCEGAVKFAKLARQAIIDKDINKSNDNIIRTEDIICELMSSLDVSKGGDWAPKLMAVYDFINRRLIQANMTKDVKIMDEVLPLIENIKDTWNQAYKLSKPVTKNVSQDGNSKVINDL